MPKICVLFLLLFLMSGGDESPTIDSKLIQSKKNDLDPLSDENLDRDKNREDKDNPLDIQDQEEEEEGGGNREATASDIDLEPENESGVLHRVHRETSEEVLDEGVFSDSRVFRRRPLDLSTREGKERISSPKTPVQPSSSNSPPVQQDEGGAEA